MLVFSSVRSPRDFGRHRVGSKLLFALGFIFVVSTTVFFCWRVDSPLGADQKSSHVAVSLALSSSSSNDDHGDGMQGDNAAIMKADLKALSLFPGVGESTVIFMHIFKCAGTSLREVFLRWALSQGDRGAVVVECASIKETNSKKICLNADNDLIDVKRQRHEIQEQKAIAGHFFWGFQRHAMHPYLMITMLRNPLELYVSAQQFKHRSETKTLEASTAWVTRSMQDRLEWEKRLDIGYIRRFVRKGAHEGVLYDDTNAESLQQARYRAALTVKRLNSCFIVGVVEQYPGFIEVLQRTLDPDIKDEENWQLAKTKMRNSSPVGSREVLEQVDPDLVVRFNTTVISLQWEVYSVALELWGSRCREVLPQEIHDVFCPVRR